MNSTYVVALLCFISFFVTLINYSILCRSEVEELNWKIKETFYALLALVIIILARLFLDVISKGYYYAILNKAKVILELTSILYILLFNIILLENIVKSTTSQIKLCKDCFNVPFYIAVLWMVFERVGVNASTADIVTTVAALAVLVMLIKILKYIKIFSLIIEPANLHPSLMAYLVFMMFYLSSILANLYEPYVAYNMYMVSFAIAVLSMILLDLEFRKIVKIHLL
jgi:hypothetical protein